MSNQSKVSVIIPCYNDHKYIEDCIDSVRNQTYPDIEIIVIDDGSDITTKEKLKSLSSKIDLLITQKNQGQAKARNEGIKKAKGEIICPIDSDDTIEPNFIEECLFLLEGDYKIKLVGTYANLIFESGKPNRLYKPEGGSVNNFLFKNSMTGGASLFYRQDALNVGGYDDEMRKGWEDWDFFLRLLQDGGEAQVVNKPLYNYLKRKQSTTTRANYKRNELFEFMYLKHNELYKQYFDEFVVHVIKNYNQLTKDKHKLKNSKEFKLGLSILKPIRFLKSILN